MCRKADVARYRNILRVNEPMPFDDGAPAIDGLFIFPEPQEQVRDDGFVEFRVTAYGRTTSEPQIKESIVFGEIVVETLLLDEDGEIESIIFLSQPSRNNQLECKIVLPSAINQDIFLQPPSQYVPTGRRVDRRPLPPNSRILPVEFILRGLSSVNFGFWSEYSYIYKAQ